jgi:hypothetical protein
MDTVYWAVKLDKKSKSNLLSLFPPRHKNVYADHMTIVFRPSKKINETLMKECGTRVKLNVIGYGEDKNCQAVVVHSNSVSRIGGGIPHITISCSEEVKPVYSNIMLGKHWAKVSQISLTGTIARFTKDGWKCI